MEDIQKRIDELAGLMEEFVLNEATLQGEGWKVSFKRPTRQSAPSAESLDAAGDNFLPYAMPLSPVAVVEQKPAGTPVTSPMNGIFYTSPSPSAPSFVKEGDTVTAGQVVGLIEAMKVFNEIVAPLSGTVDRIVAESGQLVLPGDPLLYIS